MNPFKEETSAIIAKSNSKIFESFFFDYYPRVKGFINGFLQNEEEAEDLSQDIFLSLWKNRATLHQIEHINAYLFKIARNTVYRHLQRSMLFNDYQQHKVFDTSYDQLSSSNETEESIYPQIHINEAETYFMIRSSVSKQIDLDKVRNLQPGQKLTVKVEDGSVVITAPSSVETVWTKLREEARKSGTWGHVPVAGEGWASRAEEHRADT